MGGVQETSTIIIIKGEGQFQHIIQLNIMNISILLLLTLLGACTSLRTLAILDNKQIQSTHSLFFTQLKNQGILDIKYSFQKPIDLKVYDEYQYDTIILFCTSEAISESSVNVQDLVDFFDNGGNLLVAGDIDTSRGFRKLFFAFGLELDQENLQLKDAFSHLNTASTIITSNVEKVNPYVSETLPNGGKLLYRGSGLKLGNYITNQLFGLVRGESTTYSFNHQTKQAARIGDDIVLVAAVQGLRNTRAVVTGSIDFFSDEFLENKSYDNNAFAQQLMNWVNQKTGVIRVSNVRHYSKNKDDNENVFTVTSHIHFSADIEEYDHIKEQWRPYIANDLMLEFVMLDPWVNTKLVNVKNTSKYQASFDAPTKQGIYQFKIIYQKPGFNFVKFTERVTLRPKKHDQFERFLLTAYPYYISVFATIFGSVIFVIVFLYSRFEQKQKSE